MTQNTQNTDREIFTFATKLGGTDRDPCEIIKWVSDCTIEIRHMKVERDPAYKPEFVAGGFSAVCLNQEDQKWIIEPNPENPIFRIRWSRRKKCWQDAHGNHFALAREPRKYYDYNF
jgi:hypothetical protein